MATSAAKIAANRQNSAFSTGPRTVEGKNQSRRNSLKHGMTGEGVVLPNEDQAEIENRFVAYRDELQPTGAVGETLVRRAAVLSVRLDRCVSHETAVLAERVRQAEADFVAPDGASAETIAGLKAEAQARAMFDPSEEACLARRYEAAAERGFFRALKESRQLEKQARAAEPDASSEEFEAMLASFSQSSQQAMAYQAQFRTADRPTEASLANRPGSASIPPSNRPVDVPITIGQRR